MKFCTIFLATVFLSSIVFGAQGNQGPLEQGPPDSETGATDPETQGAGPGQQANTETSNQNQGEDTNIQNRVRAENMEQLRTMMQQRQQEMEQETQGMNEKQQKVYRNQNQVRLAVHSLLAMEDLAPGIGPQVSQIAREFNNSIQSTIRAEERVQTRSRFSRFLSGGDSQAAQDLENEVIQNQERIRQLNQLREQCQCSDEAKQMMQEQIQNMEQEQIRLQELAQNEKNSKGILGWIWK